MGQPSQTERFLFWTKWRFYQLCRRTSASEQTPKKSSSSRIGRRFILATGFSGLVFLVHSMLSEKSRGPDVFFEFKSFEEKNPEVVKEQLKRVQDAYMRYDVSLMNKLFADVEEYPDPKELPADQFDNAGPQQLIPNQAIVNTTEKESKELLDKLSELAPKTAQEQAPRNEQEAAKKSQGQELKTVQEADKKTQEPKLKTDQETLQKAAEKNEQEVAKKANEQVLKNVQEEAKKVPKNKQEAAMKPQELQKQQSEQESAKKYQEQAPISQNEQETAKKSEKQVQKPKSEQEAAKTSEEQVQIPLTEQEAAKETIEEVPKNKPSPKTLSQVDVFKTEEDQEAPTGNDAKISEEERKILDNANKKAQEKVAKENQDKGNTEQEEAIKKAGKGDKKAHDEPSKLAKGLPPNKDDDEPSKLAKGLPPNKVQDQAAQEKTLEKSQDKMAAKPIQLTPQKVKEPNRKIHDEAAAGAASSELEGEKLAPSSVSDQVPEMPEAVVLPKNNINKSNGKARKGGKRRKDKMKQGISQNGQVAKKRRPKGDKGRLLAKKLALGYSGDGVLDMESTSLQASTAPSKP